MNIATAFVELRVKSDEAKAEARTEARSVAQEMTKTFAQYFSAAVVVKGLNDAVQAASRLEQAVGGTQAVFGEFSTAVDTAAQESAASLGISEAAFREVTSQIGGLLNGLGFTQEESAKTSVSLAQLGADLAATFGGRPEEAVQALGAALRGEFNPLERFGVSLRQSQINLKAVELGLAESTTQVDSNARAQAALTLIQESTTEAQGQFAREAETAAGKQAILSAKFEDAKAKLGEQLLPVFIQGVELLTTLTDLFSELPGPVQIAIAALVGIAAVAGPVNNAIKAFGGLSGILGKLPPQALVAVAAVGAAAFAYNALTAKSRELEARTNEVTAALIGGSAAMDAAAIAAGETSTEVDDLAVAFSALNEALLQGDDGGKITQALGAVGLQADDTAQTLLDLQADGEAALRAIGESAGLSGEDLDRFVQIVNGTDDEMIVLGETATQLGDEFVAAALGAEELQDQSEKIDLQKVATEFLNSAVAADEFKASLVAQAEQNVGASRSSEDAIEVYQEYGRLLAENADQLDETTGATEGLTGGLEGLTDAAEDTADEVRAVDSSALDAADAFDELDAAAQALTDAFDDLIGRNVDLDAAYSDVFEGANEVTEAFKENGATIDVNTEAGRANREAVRDQVSALLELGGQLVATGTSNEDAAAQVLELRDSLVEQMIQAGLTREAAEDYIDQLGLTPENVTTSIETAGVEQAKARIQEQITKLGEIPDEVATEIEALLDEGKYAEAERRLQNLARTRNMTIVATPSGAFDYGNGVIRYARGGYVGRSTLANIGEAGPEVVLPLTRPSRIQELMGDPRVSRPIAEALGGTGGGSMASFAPSVRVFIGDRELTDIVDVQIDARDQRALSTFQAGRRT